MTNLYAYAKVGRAGLANLLLPWARSEIFHQAYSIPMLAPQWTQFKIGPLLRGESDKRYYVNLFSAKSYIRGLRKQWLLLRGEQIPEDRIEAVLADRGTLDRPTIAIFEHLRNFFEPLLPHQRYIASRLEMILSSSSRKALDESPVDYTIGVHIRRGDKKGQAGETFANAWYIRGIQQVRQALGEDVPVKIFSDAPPADLPDILRLPNVTYADQKAAIVDIFRLSRSKVLLTSGTSTFSMWASFLGQMPTLWYPGLHRSLSLEHPDFAIETDPQGEISPVAAATIANSFKNS